MPIPFALQLYTVRDHMEKDPAATLRRVKEIGYDHVELAGLAGLTIEAFARLLKQCGLTATSHHVGYEELLKDPDAAIAATKTLGLDYCVVPWAKAESKAEWQGIARALNRNGAILRAAGIQLCYHNHAHEFTQYDGAYALDILFGEADPENLAAELDTYWIKYGGAEPVEMLEKYAGRCPLLHVKDMASTPDRTFAEMGRGILDWTRIFKAAAKADVRWLIVEQDTCPRDSLESAAISAAFMNKR